MLLGVVSLLVTLLKANMLSLLLLFHCRWCLWPVTMDSRSYISGIDMLDLHGYVRVCVCVCVCVSWVSRSGFKVTREQPGVTLQQNTLFPLDSQVFISKGVCGPLLPSSGGTTKMPLPCDLWTPWPMNDLHVCLVIFTLNCGCLFSNRPHFNILKRDLFFAITIYFKGTSFWHCCCQSYTGVYSTDSAIHL